MKLKFSIKNKEASIEADAEKLIEKNMDYKQENIKKYGPKKTRYQMKQEEKRKNKELKHKQEMQNMILYCTVFVVMVILGIIMYLITKKL